jgi:hypothetical protein
LTRTAPLIRRAAALAAAAALAGCPLPQSVPEYPATGVVTPPRLLVDAITPVDTVIRVSTTCAPAPTYTLSATLEDTDTTERVDARWFVDYDETQDDSTIRSQEQVVVADGAEDPTIRVVTPYVFRPYDWDPPPAAGGLHVVELVVSNGFAAEPAEPPAGWRPNRMPAPQFQTQWYRWVFSYVDSGGACGYPP